MGTYDWVGIVIESIEVWIVDPRLLNEFKLTRDVGIETKEVQSPILVLSYGLLDAQQLHRVDWWPILASPA